MTSADHPKPLAYEPHEALKQRGRFRVIGPVSVLLGSLCILANALIAAAMGSQLLKNRAGFKGVTSRDVEPWLLIIGIEAVLSAAIAIMLAIIGVLTLRQPGRGPSLHRCYAWLKLPLACAFGGCAGWWMRRYVSEDVSVVIAGGALAMIFSAAYPLLLLRVLREPVITASEQEKAMAAQKAQNH